MLESIDGLVTKYECGRLTRRELLASIAALCSATAAPAQTSILSARTLNHVNIRVTDVARSEAFYRKIFGLPASREVQGAAFALDLPGGGFISLCPLATKTCGAKDDARAGDIDHFAVGIDRFDAATIITNLKAAGLNVRGRARESSVWVTDPDGTNVQLSAVNERFPSPQ